MMHGYGYVPGDWTMWSGSSHHAGEWMVIPMMGFGFLLVVGLVALVIWGSRESLGLVGSGGASRSAQAAQPYTEGRPASSVEAVEQIARRRYANGEIDAAEYRAIISTLREA